MLRRAPDPDLVDLLVGDLGVLRARVQGARDGVADLHLVPAVPAGFLDGRTATLVAVNGERLVGALELGWAVGHVRFVRHGARHRRAFERVTLAVPALLVPDRPTALWRAVTQDLSLGGALLSNVADLPLGARMGLRLDLREDESVDARVRVIRVVNAISRAVLFDGLDEEARDRVARFVADMRDGREG